MQFIHLSLNDLVSEMLPHSRFVLTILCLMNESLYPRRFLAGCIQQCVVRSKKVQQVDRVVVGGERCPDPLSLLTGWRSHCVVEETMGYIDGWRSITCRFL